jgi:general secretion pathway protein K
MSSEPKRVTSNVGWDGAQRISSIRKLGFHPSLRAAPPAKQRGVALLTAILVVALATILAVDVAFSGYLDQRRSATLYVLDQGFEIAMGAEAFAAEALLQDAKNNKSDYAGETWAMPIALPIDGGQLEGYLEDMQGRFNLNNLVNAQGKVDPNTLAQFRRLLQSLQIDPKWAGMIADWIDADNVAQVPDGAEDNVYSGETPPYLTPNMAITRTSELLALKGFGLENYQKLEPYVTALPVGTPINICTAAGVVLDSFTSEGGPKQYSTSSDSTTLEKNRQEDCYPTVQQFEQSFKDDEAYKQLKQYVAQTSSYFRANIWVTIGTTEFNLYSLLHRGSSGQTRAILRSFGST